MQIAEIAKRYLRSDMNYHELIADENVVNFAMPVQSEYESELALLDRFKKKFEGEINLEIYEIQNHGLDTFFLILVDVENFEWETYFKLTRAGIAKGDEVEEETIRTDYAAMASVELHAELLRRDRAVRDFCWSTFEKSIGYFIASDSVVLTSISQHIESLNVAKKETMGYRPTQVHPGDHRYREILIEFLSNPLLLNDEKIDQMEFFEENSEFLGDIE